MPRYDYRCPQCNAVFEARHGFDDPAPACVNCGYAAPNRLITTAPRVAGGLLTHPGDGQRASKEQLRDKWAEETPRLRDKLASKFGDDYVRQNAPSLYMPADSGE